MADFHTGRMLLQYFMLADLLRLYTAKDRGAFLCEAQGRNCREFKRESQAGRGGLGHDMERMDIK